MPSGWRGKSSCLQCENAVRWNTHFLLEVSNARPSCCFLVFNHKQFHQLYSLHIRARVSKTQESCFPCQSHSSGKYCSICSTQGVLNKYWLNKASNESRRQEVWVFKTIETETWTGSSHPKSWFLMFGGTGGGLKSLRTLPFEISLVTLLPLLLGCVKIAPAHHRDSQGSNRVKEMTRFLGTWWVFWWWATLLSDSLCIGLMMAGDLEKCIYSPYGAWKTRLDTERNN